MFEDKGLKGFFMKGTGKIPLSHPSRIHPTVPTLLELCPLCLVLWYFHCRVEVICVAGCAHIIRSPFCLSCFFVVVVFSFCFSVQCLSSFVAPVTDLHSVVAMVLPMIQFGV